GEAVGVVELPVDAAEDAAHAGFFRGGPEAGKAPRHARKTVRRRLESHLIAVKKLRQDGRRGGAEAAVPGRVRGEGRRRQQWLPARIGVGRRVAVAIRLANRLDRPPEVEAKLAVPTADPGV